MRTNTARHNWPPTEVAKRAATSFTVDGNGCHISTLPVNPSGYCVVMWRLEGQRRNMSAARAAWFHHHGPIAPELTIDHRLDRCGSRRCVNIDHLRAVTLAQNTERARRTQDWPLGECRQGHPNDDGGLCTTCVYDAQVDHLLGRSARETAAKFDISIPTVHRWRRIDLNAVHPVLHVDYPIDDPITGVPQGPELLIDPADLADLATYREGFWLRPQRTGRW